MPKIYQICDEDDPDYDMEAIDGDVVVVTGLALKLVPDFRPLQICKLYNVKTVQITAPCLRRAVMNIALNLMRFPSVLYTLQVA